MEGLYTDTDPDNRSEIITDITIWVPGKAGTMMMEVKVDPGVQPSCIPLHKFKTLFPHLCGDGLPKEGLLDNTHNEFQSYNGADMTCYLHFLIDVKDCCDMGQNDTISKIELNPSFVLSSDENNYKNDIQLFHQLFDELRVNRDYH